MYMCNKMGEIMMDWDSNPGSLELFSTNRAVWSSGVGGKTSLTMGITLSPHPLKDLLSSPWNILHCRSFFLQELTCQIQGLVMVPIFFYKVKLSYLASAFEPVWLIVT